MLAVLQEEFEISVPTPVVLHGRTDAGIIVELLAINGLAPTAENFQRLCRRYMGLLPVELKRRGGAVLPRVEEILAILRGIPGCHLGLLTGHMPQTAGIKLVHFGLWEWFEFGIFGERAEHRLHLAEHARREVNNRCGQDLPSQRIILLRDLYYLATHLRHTVDILDWIFMRTELD